MPGMSQHPIFERSLRLLLLCLGSLVIPATSGLADEGTAGRLNVRKDQFGKLADGRPVDIYTLTNPQGLEARVTPYGATLVSMRVPDRQGKLDHVVLHPQTLEELVRGFPSGSVIGRFANRIANAAFTIDGVATSVEANAGKHHIHGGGRKGGFASQLWEAESLQEKKAIGVKLTLLSPDGQAGFPGTLKVTVTYRLTSANELIMDYSATTDKATHVNLTNHAYWNLAGPDSGRMLDHVVMINAKQYLPTDTTKIPTGELRAVAQTPFDFTKPATIGSRVDQVEGKIYDHCYVIDKKPGQPLTLAARVTDAASGRIMDIFTTQPGVQFYTGDKRALCLETQHFPDAPNQPKFPSTLLRPGQTYQHRTVHRFDLAM